jgi:hypothetical protein
MTNTAVLTRPIEPQQDERRRAHRQRVLLGGKLAHSNTSYSMDCVFRNLSPFGARITIPQGAVVPDQFDLIDMKNGVGYRCRAVWREYPQIGVAFDEHVNLAQADTPHFLALKRLWSASQLTG